MKAQFWILADTKVGRSITWRAARRLANGNLIGRGGAALFHEVPATSDSGCATPRDPPYGIPQLLRVRSQDWTVQARGEVAIES